MLVEFASVVDAVRCAAEVQRGMLDREADIPEGRRIRFRIGINLGDIIVDGGDIFGDGVNVAARLEVPFRPFPLTAQCATLFRPTPYFVRRVLQKARPRSSLLVRRSPLIQRTSS